jgi:hypothetical protein
MFPESFVEKWVERLTKPGDVVADPFCGRGTAPFQALLMGRHAIANDINPVAYCVTKAKTQAPPLGWAIRRLKALREGFNATEWNEAREQLPAFFALAYSEDTLRQILYLRDNLKWRSSTTDCMLAAISLGALHGDIDGPYLSNQLPRTISTKPRYSVKFWEDRGLKPPPRDAFAILEKTLRYRYQTPPPIGRAAVFNRDVRDISKEVDKLPSDIRFVITSPPYLDTTNFEEDQWLRLWFLGGPPHPTYREISVDDRHTNKEDYWAMIGDMWSSLGAIAAEDTQVVIRLAVRGMTNRQTAMQLGEAASSSRRATKLIKWTSSEIRRRQTSSFRPGSQGLVTEVDCHFAMS